MAKSKIHKEEEEEEEEEKKSIEDRDPGAAANVKEVHFHGVMHLQGDHCPHPWSWSSALSLSKILPDAARPCRSHLRARHRETATKCIMHFVLNEQNMGRKKQQSSLFPIRCFYPLTNVADSSPVNSPMPFNKWMGMGFLPIDTVQVSQLCLNLISVLRVITNVLNEIENADVCRMLNIATAWMKRMKEMGIQNTRRDTLSSKHLVPLKFFMCRAEKYECHQSEREEFHKVGNEKFQRGYRRLAHLHGSNTGC